MGALSTLFDDIDDWCGSRPRPWPRPHALRDLLVAVTVNDLAATVSDERLRQQMQNACNSLFVAACQNMASTGLNIKAFDPQPEPPKATR